MKILLTLLSGLLLALQPSLAADGWLTEIEAGIEKAKKSNKFVLVQFTGSDWCPPCQMMKKKVFSKEEFLKGAKEDFVLVVIDIPKADEELTAKNKEVMKKWGVQGVPTVLLLGQDGEEFHRFSAAQYPETDKFLAHLKRAIELKDML